MSNVFSPRGERDLKAASRRGMEGMREYMRGHDKVDRYERKVDVREAVRREDEERLGRRCKW